jgi:hypothetical protein
MQLKITSKTGIKELKDLQIGELVLCEDGKFYPVQSIAVVSMNGDYLRMSNGVSFSLHSRFRIKTEKGFKYPELWDVIPISKKLTPIVTSIKPRVEIKFFYDIMIEGNLVSPENIVFRFGD